MTQSTARLCVLGAGPGGYAAAFLAADLGLDVTLIDRELDPGGVCLYRGCIPSKALLHVARLIGEARHAADWGVHFPAPRIDLDALRDWKTGVVKRLTGGLGQLSKQRKVSYVRGQATLLDARRLRVDGGGTTEIAFEHAILATGSRPARIPSLWLDSPRVLDSTSALDIESVPNTLLVIGGGYIGLELGSVYAALGSAVTVVEMTPGLLPGADRDLVNVLARRLEKSFEAILLGTRVVEMREERGGIKVRLEGAQVREPEQVFEKVLVAVGRKPNSDIPGLGSTRVEIDARGFLKVDEQRRTAEPTLFAIGDVAGEPMLAHKASHEGRVAAEAVAGHAVAFEPRAIPAVVFTDPEIAWCGLTETQAAEQKRTVTIARFPWAASGRAMTLDRPEGVTKLVIDPETEQVLGVGIAGPGAGELIAEATLAVEMAATAKDVALTIHAHPTLSETIMESAEVFFGEATHLFRRRQKTEDRTQK